MSTSKVRVHEISKQLGVSNAAVIDVLAKEFGVQAKSHSSTVEQAVADKLIAHMQAGSSSGKAPEGKKASVQASVAAPAKSATTVAPQQDSAPAKPPTSAVTTQAAISPRTESPSPNMAQAQRQPAGARPSSTSQPSASPPTHRGVQSPANVQRPQQGSAGQRHPGQNPATSRPGSPPQAPVKRAPLGNSAAPIRIVPERDPDSMPRNPYPQYGQRPQGRPQQHGQRPAPAASAHQQNRPSPATGSPSRPYSASAPPSDQSPRYPQPEPMRGPNDAPGAPSGHGRPAHRPGGGNARYGKKDGPKKDDSPNKGLFGAPQKRSGGGRNRRGNSGQSQREREEELASAVSDAPKIVKIDEPIIVRDLAILLRLRDTEIIKHLFMKGMMVTVNQTLDVDFAKTVAREFEFEVEESAVEKHEGEYTHLAATEDKKLDDTKFLNLTSRSPVVSIMGHVDHGKTTLLDAIRETRHKIVDTEAGGITQSIGAYTVQKDDGHRIVFLDTPGHEAFTSMRMRGAQATDIAILVVAADDGVMPQTIEAINHAKAAKIPIIIAVNKIDKADADPDKVLVQLAEYGLSAEKWGGDTLTVEVSALQKLGLDDLLDSIVLVSELLELKADATVPAEGVIIEAQLDKRTGPVATALIRNGHLKVGDNILIGSVGGRVRALIDDHGARITDAGPSTPVSILGLDGVPRAGDAFRIVENDKEFKTELMNEKQRLRDERIGMTRSVAGFSGRLETEENKESQFNLLVKADTQGSLEAVLEVLNRMTSEEIKINIVHSATGDISEADVMLASTASALLIGFNVKPDPNSQRMAEQSGVMIKRYDVIYHITEDIEKWVLGQLSPEMEETHSGTAEIRQIFKVGKNNVIAGCMVTSGKVLRNAKAVVTRDGKEIFSGTLTNLKRFKDDAKEVASGYECGISFDKFQELQEGDLIDVYVVKSMERTSL